MSESIANIAVVTAPIKDKGRRLSQSLAVADQMVADRRRLWEKLGWLLMAALLGLGLPMAYQRAIANGPDLAGFCDAGRYILQHGTRDPGSTLSRYWPSADVPWIALARLPISVMAVLWYLGNCAAWLACYIRFALACWFPNHQAQGRAGSPSYTARRHATLAAGLLAMPLVIDGMALGSFHVLMLWLMLLGLDRACAASRPAAASC